MTTGSNQDFPLSKNIISNQQAKEMLAGTFNEVVISEEKFDSEKIKRIYNDLFYLISKKGKKSHTTIIEQSTDYVYPWINKNLDDSIEKLSGDISELSSLLVAAESPVIIPQHPIYENGLLLQKSANGTSPDDPNSDIYYMQQGLKRTIQKTDEGYYIRMLRQANGDISYEGDGITYIPIRESPLFRYVTSEDLNTIENGEPITGGSSLSVNPVKKIDPQYVYDEIKIELHCQGIESFYKFGYGEPGYDYDLSGYPATGGYWYLDTNGTCKVKTEQDIDPTTGYKSISGYTSIPAGTSKTLTISRDKKFYGHSIGDPSTDNPLEYGFYQGNHQELETRSGYNQNLPSLWKWKRWGPGTPFPSITYVEPGSRMSYRMISPFREWGVGNFGPVDGGESHNLNAIIDGRGPNGSAIQQGHPEQEGILDSYYNSLSHIGTRMINNSCYGPLGENGCYGALGHFQNIGTAHGGIHNLFSNPNNAYYLDNINGRNKTFTNSIKAFGATVWSTTHTVKGRVYGQPIIKVDGQYCVFLESYRVRYISTAFGDLHRDYNVFIQLNDGNIFRIQNKDLEGRVTGYKRIHNDFFNWFDTNKKNNPSIVYPGLKGYSINYENTDLDAQTNTFLMQDILGMLGSMLTNIGGSTYGLNKVGNQLKDNPFNPSEGGSNYSWILKSSMKTTT
jgi:hypothetical protein